MSSMRIRRRCPVCGGELVVHRGLLVCSQCGLVVDLVYLPGRGSFNHIAPIDLRGFAEHTVYSNIVKEFGEQALRLAKKCGRASLDEVYRALRYLVLGDDSVNPRELGFHAMVCAREIASKLGYKLSRVEAVKERARKLIVDYGIRVDYRRVVELVEKLFDKIASGYSVESLAKTFICIAMMETGDKCPWRKHYYLAKKLRSSS